VLPPAAPGDALLIVPDETTAAAGAWWRIDPRTGETLGVDAAGRGSVVFEYVMTKFNIAREAMVQYRLIGCVVAAKVATVTMLIGLLQDRPSTGSPLEVTRDPLYQIARASVKQAACFFSAITFGGGPAASLYGAGAMVGLASILESVGSFGVARYLDASD
jgi:hypothetical protein